MNATEDKMELSIDFGHAREIIHSQAEHHWDAFYSPNIIEFEDFDTIRIGSSEYEVGQHAKRLIGQRLGVPAPYINRCPPALQAENLNYWLRQQDKDIDLFCRFEDDTLRAIFTKRYTPMDNHEIIQQLDVPLDTRCILNMDASMMQLSIPDRASRFEVVPNDEIMPGVALSNSEVGMKCFAISAYYLRIVCTNGLISTDQVSHNFRHTSTRGLDNFYDVMQGVSMQVLRNSEQFKIAIDAPAENPLALIENFSKLAQLTKKDIEHVTNYFEPPDTMWAVINAFTAAANDPMLPVEKSFAYQRIGGRILSLTK